jgi:hypothetical protein
MFMGWTTGIRFLAGTRIFRFYIVFKPALGHTQPLMQWVPGSLAPGIRRSEREAVHSPESYAEVNNKWSCRSASLLHTSSWLDAQSAWVPLQGNSRLKCKLSELRRVCACINEDGHFDRNIGDSIDVHKRNIISKLTVNKMWNYKLHNIFN